MYKAYHKNQEHTLCIHSILLKKECHEKKTNDKKVIIVDHEKTMYHGVPHLSHFFIPFVKDA